MTQAKRGPGEPRHVDNRKVAEAFRRRHMAGNPEVLDPILNWTSSRGVLCYKPTGHGALDPRKGALAGSPAWQARGLQAQPESRRVHAG